MRKEERNAWREAMAAVKRAKAAWNKSVRVSYGDDDWRDSVFAAGVIRAEAESSEQEAKSLEEL